MRSGVASSCSDYMEPTAADFLLLVTGRFFICAVDVDTANGEHCPRCAVLWSPHQSCHMHPAHLLGHSGQRSVALARVSILPATLCVLERALLELEDILRSFCVQQRSYGVIMVCYFTMPQQEA